MASAISYLLEAINTMATQQSDTVRGVIFAENYLSRLTGTMGRIDLRSVGMFIEVLVQGRERDARIFFLGNGGSAATASHFANDLSIGTKSQGKPFRVISLAENLSILTAIANDYGYEEIFTRQLRAQMLPDDIVVAISASGNSPNAVKAIEYANANGARTVALTGFDGGALKAIAHLAVHVPTSKGEYGQVEDAHLILNHLIGAYLTEFCRQESTLK